MRVLSSRDVLIIVRKIETTDGIKPHRDPRINGIPMAVIIFPKYAGCRMIL
jgi:hypothetical protein